MHKLTYSVIGMVSALAFFYTLGYFSIYVLMPLTQVLLDTAIFSREFSVYGVMYLSDIVISVCFAYVFLYGLFSIFKIKASSTTFFYVIGFIIIFLVHAYYSGIGLMVSQVLQLSAIFITYFVFNKYVSKQT